ncbi:MAG: T9SS type A sorting domain-containing protein [Ignavibacteria bacterium]|nr:T9SS type A sorting domain-containing protein [Ignavibacteria bacterium]
MKKILIVLFFLLTSVCFAQQGWVYLNPTPTAASRYDLTMFSESSGICRGTNSIFRTFNGGISWTEYNLVNSEQYILSFSMVDSTFGFLITGSNNLLKTVDGGKNWNFVSQVPFYSRKIKFITETDGFILTNEGNGGAKILKTTNSGLNWSEYFSDENNAVRDMHFVSPMVGFAVGSFPPNSSSHAKIFKTTNSGISWDSIPNTLRLASEIVFFVNENTGFVSGAINSPFSLNRILRTTNGGVTWGDTLKYGLTDIRFFDANSGYLLMNDTILGRTSNAGANWTISKIRNQTITYCTRPTQLFFVNQTSAVCIGSLGLNLKTTDNGNSWINYNYSFTSEELLDVEFKNLNIGFILSWNHCYYKTTNAGQNWVRTSMGSSDNGFNAMAYAGGSTWYIAAYDNLIYKTTNDGNTWDSSRISIYQVTDLKFINENTGFGVCKYNTFFKTTNGGVNWYINSELGSQNFTVNFIDENTGFVGGGGRLRKTTDGGITFDTIPRTNIYSAWDVKFINRDTIFVSGYTSGSNNIGTVWKSTNAGVSWIPHYLPVGLTYGLIDFPTSQTGYISEYNVVFKTTNSGENWFKIKSPDNYMHSTFFINSETGYAVGDYGVIAKTTDGGASTFINTNESVVKSFSLYQNYPNPFNPSTKIKFDLPKNENVKIIIFDILGRKLETLLDENLIAGVHAVKWNASKYAAGVYFYMLLTDGIKETKKMVLVK